MVSAQLRWTLLIVVMNNTKKLNHRSQFKKLTLFLKPENWHFIWHYGQQTESSMTLHVFTSWFHISHMTLGKLPNFSGPQFTPLWNGHNSDTFLLWLLGRLPKIIHLDSSLGYQASGSAFHVIISIINHLQLENLGARLWVRGTSGLLIQTVGHVHQQSLTSHKVSKQLPPIRYSSGIITAVFISCVPLENYLPSADLSFLIYKKRKIIAAASLNYSKHTRQRIVKTKFGTW